MHNAKIKIDFLKCHWRLLIGFYNRMPGLKSWCNISSTYSGNVRKFYISILICMWTINPTVRE